MTQVFDVLARAATEGPTSLATESARMVVPLYIDGDWQDAADGRTFESVNPATGEGWVTVVEAGPEDVDRAVGAARRAADGVWLNMPAADRGRILWRLAEQIDRHRLELARIESLDNGKALAETTAEIDAVVRHFEYFAGLCQAVRGHTMPSTGQFFTYTRREPVGVVAAIVPWNSPLLMLTWKVGPALAGGNTIILKPSEDTPVSAAAFAALCDEVDLPPGVFNLVQGFGPRAGEALVTHPDVDKLAFTGSTETGKRIAAMAAASVKLVTFELGGKSPNIVFGDADLDAAVSRSAFGIFSASGQSCIAASRMLVESSVLEEFVGRIADVAGAIRVGDPLDPSTQVGAITSSRQLEKIRKYVDIGLREGADLVTGGKAPNGKDRGFFFMPTVFAGVRNDMRLAQEEIFGPVTAIIGFDDEREALRIANDTRYGLAAAVWTTDVKRAHRVAHGLKVGTVWINNYRVTNWLMPFGGVKESGIGRENGIEVMEHYTQIKSVWVDLAEAQASWPPAVPLNGGGGGNEAENR